MTHTVHYPSEAFPAVPPVSMKFPDGWEPAFVPDSLLAVKKPHDGRFATNVIVRSQRVAPEATVEEAAKVVDTEVDKLAEVADIDAGFYEMRGGQNYGREFSFRDPAAGTIGQVWRVFMAQGERASELFEVVGTLAPSGLADIDELRSIVNSVVVAG